ncbi:hypothetical protein D9M68_376250 [compost metagenome]
MTIRAEGVRIAKSWLDAAFADAHQRALAVPQDPSPSLPAASQRHIRDSAAAPDWHPPAVFLSQFSRS